MDKYKFIKKIGIGSYGSIYLVQNIYDKKYCAMKELDLKLTSTKEKQMIINEIIIGSFHNCPYIIKYEEILFKDNKIYMKMKHCKQGNLKKYLEHNKILSTQKNIILRKVLLAVQYLHYNKVIHRDIKSDNILIHDGNPYLADFGTCCILHDFEYFGKTCIGTPYYISPEIIEGKEYTYHTDIYSLGCLFCEIYKNKLPYTGNNLYNLYYNVMNSKQVIKFNNSTLDTLIQSMINKSYINRPTIQELIEKFHNYSQFNDKINLFKKDKKFSSKIKQKYTIPTDWQYFINISINKNNLLPKI
jgi:NIMA (never in mitosis gene a)-related kinase 1/4/5